MVTLTVSALVLGGSRDAAAEVMRARAVCVWNRKRHSELSVFCCHVHICKPASHLLE